MSDRVWYLDCRPEDVADRAILVGDPQRIDVFADRLDDVRVVGQNRGLRTLTGTADGTPVTICAFGMGAPIAVIALEELAQLGVRTVLRAGTVMALRPGVLGDLVVAAAAVREESTSRTYLPQSFPAVPDLDLLVASVASLDRLGERYRVGLVASLDGFYSEMFAARPEREPAVAERLRSLADRGVIAADMETSAILAVAPRLGVRAGSLCLASVDGTTRASLEGEARDLAERRLVKAALAAITVADGAFRRAVEAGRTLAEP
jgi:uridine phosphorylase